MDPEALRAAPLVAALTAVGFVALAFILLYPIWRFLKREEEVSRGWTDDEIARASRREPHGGDGAGAVGNGGTERPPPR